MLAYIAMGVGYGFAATMQPGPFQAYVVAQSLKQGWRRALPAAFAPLVTDGPIILLVILVLTRVPGWMLLSLYIAGGLFILYLAYNAYAGWRDFDAESKSEEGGKQSIIRAAALNALSPGPYLFWSLVTGPILVSGFKEATANGVGFLAGFYVAMIGSLAGIIIVFGVARHLGPRINRALLGVSAVALAGFGIYQLWRGISGLAAG